MRDINRLPPTTADAAGVAAETLFKRVTEIIDGARGRLARAVNSAMVQAYWETGRAIVEIEQAGEPRADYGAQLIATWSECASSTSRSRTVQRSSIPEMAPLITMLN